MTKCKKMLSLFLGVAMLAGVALVAGCSSDKKEAAADQPFRVGMECGYAPFNWTQTNADNGAVKIAGSQEYAGGYDVMIAKMLADSMGRKLEIHKIEWDGLAPAVDSGKVDAVIAGMSITKKRQESVDFSNVYYNASVVALTKKGTPYAAAKSVADLKGATVTSQLNTIWYNMLPQIPDAKIQPGIDNVPGMIVALTSGKVDLVVTDKPTAMAAAFSNPDLVMVDFSKGQGFKVSKEDVEMGVAVKKGNAALLKKINDKLAAISEADRSKLMETAIKNQPLAH